MATVPGPGLDSQAITGVELEDYFVSRANGLPLTFGKVYFYQDDARTTPKAVFQLVQGSASPPDYTYSALPNPMTLSATGTFVDAGGNNIAVYYYPVDNSGVQQLYYVKVYDQYGNLQFTREAWPFPSNLEGGGGGGGTTTSSSAFYNQITNGQFVKVLFNQGESLVIPYTSAGISVDIAPGWTLVVTASGNGSVTVTQTPVTGSSAYPHNPPFTLDVTAGANTTTMYLQQTLSNNPDWAAPATIGVAGYLSASILLGPSTSVSVQYKANPSGTAQTILNAANGSGQYATESGTVQLSPASSAQNGINGSDSIIINLAITGTSKISNVQVIPLTTNITGVAYDPVPSNRQIDYMFHYYNPLLQYKPIPSHLVGWDFPLNPAQFLGDSVAAQAVGASKSYYAWDQTIVFQTTDSGITISRDASGALKTLSAQNAGTQLALVQYIPAPQAIEMLSRRKCVNVSAKASVATDATVSLWYTTGALPSTVGSNLSLVLTLDSKGYPATQNNTWVKVPRSGLANNTVTSGSTNAAQFTIGTSATANFNQYPLTGWDMLGAADITNATFFAIVVGTASIAHNAYILWQSISCQDGDIATVPAAQSANKAVSDCQYYYQKSFALNQPPIAGLGYNTGEFYGIQTNLNGRNNIGYNLGTVIFQTPMRSGSPTIVIYNPTVASPTPGYNLIRGMASGVNYAGTATVSVNQNGFVLFSTTTVSNVVGDATSAHWSADGRLGL